jgi:transmembrane sensor
MTPEEYIKLYEKFNSGQCTPEEENLLMEYQDGFDLEEAESDAPLKPADKQKRAMIYNRIRESLVYRGPQKKVARLWGWAAAAATVLLVSGLFIFKQQPQQQITANQPKKSLPVKPIKPGSNTAVLTLANGANIKLDDAKNGVLAQAGHIAVKKLANGLIAYTNTGEQAPAADQGLNTVTVPRGGQYSIKLPDGTMVWLNSASSISYPVAFTGADRRVTLTGEAYFEVTKNKHLPFIVHTGKMDVKVLGTHFNVAAYSDEATVKTTLLEGSVSLFNGKSSAMLVPGQQGVVDADLNIVTGAANVNQAIAWKTGYFLFRDNDIREIMNQLSRWYDVDITYQGDITHRRFGGIYARNKDISELLKGLELTGLIHFKIDERRIIVMN